MTLEVFWARYAADDPNLGAAMWSEIDETSIPVQVRRELARNGFRVGVIGTVVPEVIARTLRVKGSADDPLEPANLLVEPQVRRRRLQLTPARRAEIQASETIAEMPLLVCREGELGGATYRNGQALYAVQIEPQADGRVEVQLTPEIHHGSPQLRYTSGDGILRQAAMRESVVFSELRVGASLAAGEMLVLAGATDADSRLGHYFHTIETSAGRQQKLVVVRLAQIPASLAFRE